MINLLTPVKFVRCGCGVTFSFDPAKTHYRRFCDTCRAKRAKQHDKKVNSKRFDYSSVVGTLGGPAIFKVIDRAAVRTREEVGKNLGMSAERVRQIEMQALAKLFAIGHELAGEPWSV